MDGKSILQETRLWDTDRKVTFSMRSKEEADEYRYFPDPDLPLVRLSEKQIEIFRENLPELPETKKSRFIEKLGFYNPIARGHDKKMEIALERLEYLSLIHI